MAESMQGLHRTCRCAEVTKDMVGSKVTLMGWVQKARNKGGIVFVDLRDRSGIMQLIFENGNIDEEGFEKAGKLRSEFVIAVTGTVENRGGAVNENLATGAMELRAESLRILAESDYTNLEANVEKISETLEQHQVRLLKDSAMMDKMYEQNLLYFKELSMYIQAGKLSLSRMRDGKLKELEEKAKLTGLPEDAQAARDLADQCERFEKKLYDLELTRNISLQMGPQIRLLQNNNTMMAEKIQTTLVNTIPLWKSQMVLALGIAHSTEAAQAQSQVSDLTNELLRKNAEKLHMASVETAKESERGIVDMETLQKTNADLIQTLDDVMKIQREGREKRQAAEAEMLKMENDLKAKLLEIQH